MRKLVIENVCNIQYKLLKFKTLAGKYKDLYNLLLTKFRAGCFI